MEKVTVTFVGPISHEWAISQPFVLTWIVLAALDFALGTMAAWVRREISSTVSWRGMMRKGVTVEIRCIPLRIPLRRAYLEERGKHEKDSSRDQRLRCLFHDPRFLNRDLHGDCSRAVCPS